MTFNWIETSPTPPLPDSQLPEDGSRSDSECGVKLSGKWRNVRVRQLSRALVQAVLREGSETFIYLCTPLSVKIQKWSRRDRSKSRECCRVSNDPFAAPCRVGGTRTAWDPFDVLSVSPPSGCLLTVLQVVDDPRDGLLSCGAHCTLCVGEKTRVWEHEHKQGRIFSGGGFLELLFTWKKDIYETDGSSHIQK